MVIVKYSSANIKLDNLSSVYRSETVEGQEVPATDLASNPQVIQFSRLIAT